MSDIRTPVQGTGWIVNGILVKVILLVEEIRVNPESMRPLRPPREALRFNPNPQTSSSPSHIVSPRRPNPSSSSSAGLFYSISQIFLFFSTSFSMQVPQQENLRDQAQRVTKSKPLILLFHWKLLKMYFYQSNLCIC
jgi:hypothetical protein